MGGCFYLYSLAVVCGFPDWFSLWRYSSKFSLVVLTVWFWFACGFPVCLIGYLCMRLFCVGDVLMVLVLP